MIYLYLFTLFEDKQNSLLGAVDKCHNLIIFHTKNGHLSILIDKIVTIQPLI